MVGWTWVARNRFRTNPFSRWLDIFFYFGHFYASGCIQALPAERRAGHQDQLAHRLLKLQEADGSWWDYPLYNYHQQYGTAFALMSLVACR